jgi:DNA modification methylase
MTDKRRALEALTKAHLVELGRSLEVEVRSSMSVDEVRGALARSKRASLDRILPLLDRAGLQAICAELGLPSNGKDKQALMNLILGTEQAPQPKGASKAPKGNGKPAPAPQMWLTFPEVTPATEAERSDAQRAAQDLTLPLEVEARKPKLVWNGMWRKEVATAVPTQVLEIVHPGRAVARGSELAGLEIRQVSARDTTMVPPNRLIWTNDNLVALQTLLDERDPGTRDYRYRGKVDLVYIDPPFMVNNDFRADNSIDIELDDDVQAKKEPSLVEILAYKDTWRQGLDSFLTMLRRRLELLKQLLAPTGSIYVHLDWHAVHYVKVLMDEIFGYENFQNEIVWKRSSAHSDAGQGSRHFGRVLDTILFYANGGPSYWQHQFVPYDLEYVASDYKRLDPDGRRYRIGDLSGPGGEAKGNPYYEFLGVSRYWRYSKESMEELYRQGRIIQTKPGAVPQYKRYLDEMPGVALQNIWTDCAGINNRSAEVLGYPTQKPVALLERIIAASSPPGGVVLDCFVGSGTACEAAERLGRRWIGIDNGKFAVHLARKRLIQLHGQPRIGEKQPEYVECAHCKNIERKEKPQRSPGLFQVQPFTVENMGVYQRAEQWQDFQTQRSRYRDEMIKVFGGEPIGHSPLLHGRKGGQWVHVGPLDGPVSIGQVWNIAREAQRTTSKAVTVLSADFDTLSGGEKDDIRQKTGVTVTIRVIPANALDEVRRRLELMRANPDEPIESMAIPAFYSPLSIVLGENVSGRTVRLSLDRCEVDIESFVNSQRPALKPITEGMTPAARKKAKAELDKWDARRKALDKWLSKATTWQKFIDFWAIDWDYGGRVSPDGKPIFETDWQSFRIRRGKGETEPLVFAAEFKYEQPGTYRVAARVTDVFGNDGIATVTVEVR